LEPAEPGLFKLKGNPAPVSFMLTGEISGIYKRGGAVRKVHSLVAVPSLDAAARVNMRLSRIGNIVSDGRPILGLDPRNLLEILLEADPASVLIPAHIWTPWFSMLGSKSGFDSPLECFGELADKVFAVETGLSSDPPMNWRVPCLDRLALVSNSDLHSPQNLGRNANIFFGEPDYHRMFRGLRERDPALCGGTLDLFPEEGKYHLDGHRDCGVVLHPAESRALENICPVCGRELTLGVLHRVEQLADPARVEGERPAGRTLPWRPFIPLPELLGELLDAAPTSLKNTRCYDALLAQFGPEMEVLLDAPLDDIARHSKVPLLDEALRRMREGRVFRSGGYDGVYGEIRVFAKGERDALLGAGDFFNFEGFVARQKKRGADLPVCATHPACLPRHTDREVCVTLDTAQQAAIDAPAFENLLIIAGPGSGKTRVLVQRVARLVSSSGVSPSEILAITFTCRAAAEIRERLGRADSPLPAECPGQPLLEPQGGAQGTARPTFQNVFFHGCSSIFFTTGIYAYPRVRSALSKNSISCAPFSAIIYPYLGMTW
ncbi:MAG: UvrD-helicase domain-containing protein, partial [Kiritimatiellaeota bacterium]|nr:UvrD-helicase domain-containing protein [Kiritimatiellota bacterium]